MSNKEQILIALRNIKTSPDGETFIAYLKELSLQNYTAFKSNGEEMNELHKGYAQALDKLIDNFQECDTSRNMEINYCWD